VLRQFCFSTLPLPSVLQAAVCRICSSEPKQCSISDSNLCNEVINITGEIAFNDLQVSGTVNRGWTGKPYLKLKDYRNKIMIEQFIQEFLASFIWHLLCTMPLSAWICSYTIIPMKGIGLFRRLCVCLQELKGTFWPFAVSFHTKKQSVMHHHRAKWAIRNFNIYFRMYICPININHLNIMQQQQQQ
jgi:hypothetical protein